MTTRKHPSKRELGKRRRKEAEELVEERLAKGTRKVTIAKELHTSKRTVQRIHRRLNGNKPLKKGRPRQEFHGEDAIRELPIIDEIEGTTHIVRVVEGPMKDERNAFSRIARRKGVSRRTVVRRVSEGTYKPDEIMGGIEIQDKYWGKIWTRIVKPKK